MRKNTETSARRAFYHHRRGVYTRQRRRDYLASCALIRRPRAPRRMLNFEELWGPIVYRPLPWLQRITQYVRSTLRRFHQRGGAGFRH